MRAGCRLERQPSLCITPALYLTPSCVSRVGDLRIDQSMDEHLSLMDPGTLWSSSCELRGRVLI